MIPVSFSTILSTALVETLEHHCDRLPGDKIYGATLVRAEDTFLPCFAVLADLGEDLPAQHRWCPDHAGTVLQTPRLIEVCSLFDVALDSTPALARALGSHPVRQAFARLGAEPILYIFERRADGPGAIEKRTFASLNEGRESEPYYVQAVKFLS